MKIASDHVIKTEHKSEDHPFKKRLAKAATKKVKILQR